MNDKPFFDTNVLLYTLARSDARSNTSKGLLRGGGVTSVHVLNEFIAVARRRLKMPWKEIHEALEDFRILCPEPVPITLKTHEGGIRIAERFGYSIYDSLVIATAIEASCGVLYSEDMHNGQRIEGVTIRNPFLPAQN